METAKFVNNPHPTHTLIQLLILACLVATIPLHAQAIPAPKKQLSLEEQLFDAAEKGLVNVVRALVGRGAKVNSTTPEGKTPLMLACLEGQLTTIQLLVESGADLEIKEPKGMTAVMIAAQRGHEESVKWLISKGAKTDMVMEGDLTCLLLAVDGGKAGVVKVLVENGANLNAKDSRAGETALFKSASSGKWDITKTLLEAKDIQVNTTDRMLRTPLILAARENQPEIIKLLIEKGADVSAADLEDTSPIWWCIENNNLETASLLLEKKPNLTIRRERMTPLKYAIAKANQGMIDLLKKAGAQEEYTETAVKTEAVEVPIENDSIFGAAERGDVKRIKSFVVRRVKLNSKDSDGNTPLHIAAKYGQLEAVKYLLENKADVDPLNRDEWTPLMLAADQGRTEVCIQLLETGADWKIRNRQDTTVLMQAVTGNHDKTVTALLARGVDPNNSRKDGMTAIKLARSRNYLQIINILLKAGARE